MTKIDKFKETIGLLSKVAKEMPESEILGIMAADEKDYKITVHVSERLISIKKLALAFAATVSVKKFSLEHSEYSFVVDGVKIFCLKKRKKQDEKQGNCEKCPYKKESEL